MTARGSVALLVAVAVAIAIAGCGGTSDREQVRTTVKKYLSALADGAGRKACDQLTGSQSRALVQGAIEKLPELRGSTCTAVLNKISGSLGADNKQTLRDADNKQTLRDANVITVHVGGTSATAELQGGTRKAELTKHGGRWLISGGLRL